VAGVPTSRPRHRRGEPSHPAAAARSRATRSSPTATQGAQVQPRAPEPARGVTAGAVVLSLGVGDPRSRS
jgi:hypothetical protein